MNTESGIPVTGLYADKAPSGYIEPPTSTQFHSGVEPEMTLPAAWWNYFVNLFTNTNIKTKEDITAILAELNNALTTMGITPDPESSNQLATLFQNDVLPVTFANANMNANPYTTSSLVPKHRGNIAINTTTRTTWIATNTTAAAASWSRLWSPENDGTGSGLDADLVRGTTPGTRGLQYLVSAAVSNIAALILADLKTVDGSGSGLDADLLDGQQGSYYAPIASPAFTGTVSCDDGEVAGTLTVGGGLSFNGGYIPLMLASNGICLDISNGDIHADLDTGFYMGASVTNAPNADWYYFFVLKHNSIYKSIDAYGLTYAGRHFRKYCFGGGWTGWDTVWNSGNDGHGSGLDADLLDGQHAESIKQAVTGIQVRTSDPSSPSDGTIWLRSNV